MTSQTSGLRRRVILFVPRHLASEMRSVNFAETISARAQQRMRGKISRPPERSRPHNEVEGAAQSRDLFCRRIDKGDPSTSQRFIQLATSGCASSRRKVTNLVAQLAIPDALSSDAGAVVRRHAEIAATVGTLALDGRLGQLLIGRPSRTIG